MNGGLSSLSPSLVATAAHATMFMASRTINNCGNSPTP